MTSNIKVVIGGGAAGFFGAIACAAAHPSSKVIILEKTSKVLSKVRISGGGRCNVTHACFDPALLVNYYPRGSKALRGPFNKFQPKDTIEWFESRGVKLKVEDDGRMFPTTDSSQTIIDCLTQEAKKHKVEVRLNCSVEALEKTSEGFLVHIKNETPISCSEVLLTSGSHPTPLEWAKTLGHTIVPAVPSLFTFNIPKSPLVELSGVSVDPVSVKISNTNLIQKGPILVTHWGFSGPAILKLSAWGARTLHDMGYKAELVIDWLPEMNEEQLFTKLKDWKANQPRKQLGTDSPFGLSKNLWKKQLALLDLNLEEQWSRTSNDQLRAIARKFHADKYLMDGKSTYKEEFVTCGGINLDEVNFKTMESKCCPGLFFAGEVLDIDGVTGGFNFQNAWTTSWIAGNAMGEREG